MIKKYGLLLCAVPCLFVSLIAQAAPVIQYHGLPSLETINLSAQEVTSSTPVERDIDFCVVSRTKNDPPKRQKFDFKITDQRDSSQFNLVNGSKTLPITFKTASSYDDKDSLVGLNTLEEMQPGKKGSKKYTGALSCDGTDGQYGKSRIRVTINTNTLVNNLAAGTYENTFQIESAPNGAGNTAEQDVTIRVVMPPLVQISRLNDMTLSEIGNQGYIGAENFCVYSSTGDFLINASGEAQDGGNFFLHSGTNSLPYSVILSSTGPFGSTHTVTPGQKVDINTQPVDCRFEDNSQIGIAVTKNDTTHAQSGDYTGLVTLTVEPL